MADIIHNVPLQLLRVSEGTLEITDVIEDIRTRAKRRPGFERWIDEELERLRDEAGTD
jgi:hypothetical protein